MCLAIIALNVLPEWPLIVLANRDELHSRPTLAASPWSEADFILGGRDVRAGGTWLGLSSSGKIALLTNFREPGQHDPEAPSRGRLAEDFLKGEHSPSEYAHSLHKRGNLYNGFNLLLADQAGLWYCSNRGGVNVQQVHCGVVGISNASLNTPWPKLTRTQTAVAEYLSRVKVNQGLNIEPFFEIMLDTRSASLDELPDTGVGPEREKLLGSPFIKNERYGTRCTTLIMKRADGSVRFHEKSFESDGLLSGESLWTLQAEGAQFLSGTVETFGC